MLARLGVWIWDANLLSVVPLGLAWLVSHALVRARASVRHHVWAVSLAVALLSPPTTFVTPRIDLRVLPDWPRLNALLMHMEQPRSEMTLRSVTGVAMMREHARVRWLISPGMAIWLAGAGGLLLVRLWRRVRLARLTAKTRLWDAPERIGVHEDVIVPMLAGLHRPTILLPAAATEWPPVELEAILAHERAHLTRRDHVIALLSDVATIVYWLNPLVWVAAVSLERERERACDDAVLQAGVKPSVYAAALVRIGQGVSGPPRLVGALTMARGGLSARVRHLLAARPHPSGQVPLSWPRTAALIGLCTMAVTSVHVVARAPGLQADDILVTVNGERLTTADLDRRQVDARRVRPPAAGDAPLPQQLVEAVDELLVVQRGKALGYTMSDEQFTRVLDNIKKDNKIESQEQFDAALQQAHVTQADLRRTLERQLIVSRLQSSQLSNGLGVTEEDARQYYTAHADEFSGAPFEQVRDQVNRRVATSNRQRSWETYLEALRSQASFDWKRPDVKRSYDEGLADRANAVK